LTIKRLSFLTIILTYALIVFGGYVASSESGMGCGPEWPLCNGSVIPVLQGDTLIEFAHRVIGAVLFVITILLFLKVMRLSKEKIIRSVAWGMLFLLIIQVFLGAVVVILDLPAIIVSAHLIIAILFLASVIWLWGRGHGEGLGVSLSNHSLNEEKRQLISKHLNILIVFLIVTFAFGGYIKHQSYGLACGWLDCRDSIIPSTIPELLQTIHRVLAIVTTIYILLLNYFAYSKRWGTAIQNRFLFASFIIFVQLILGVFTIQSYLDISLAILHLAAGTALFAFIYEMRVYVSNVEETVKLTTFSNNRKSQLLR